LKGSDGQIEKKDFTTEVTEGHRGSGEGRRRAKKKPHP
jgi:hypothetical protein